MRERLPLFLPIPSDRRQDGQVDPLCYERGPGEVLISRRGESMDLHPEGSSAWYDDDDRGSVLLAGPVHSELQGV